MKKNHLLPHEEVKVPGSAARWRRSSRSVRLALLAALVLLLLTGGAPAAAPKKAPAFTYSYRVLQVELYGRFDTTTTMGRRGEDITFSGKEEILVFGKLMGENTDGDPLKDLPVSDDLLFPLGISMSTFNEGTLTLQNPRSDMGVNGMLKTSDFKRLFFIKGAGVDGDGKNFSCGEDINDVGGFGGAMRLSGTDKVKVHWVLPGVGYKCGPVTVDYNDQNRLKRIDGDPAESSADDPNQEAQTYPLSTFLQKRFELKINIAHSWEPDYATKADVIWKGRVLLERIESGKGK
jgi:hypothetical protein